MREVGNVNGKLSLFDEWRSKETRYIIQTTRYGVASCNSQILYDMDTDPSDR